MTKNVFFCLYITWSIFESFQFGLQFCNLQIDPHLLSYSGMDSDGMGSAVCYTIYTIYISLCIKTAGPIISEPFSRIPLYVHESIIKNFKFFEHFISTQLIPQPSSLWALPFKK